MRRTVEVRRRNNDTVDRRKPRTTARASVSAPHSRAYIKGVQRVEAVARGRHVGSGLRARVAARTDIRAPERRRPDRVKPRHRENPAGRRPHRLSRTPIDDRKQKSAVSAGISRPHTRPRGLTPPAIRRSALTIRLRARIQMIGACHRGRRGSRHHGCARQQRDRDRGEGDATSQWAHAVPPAVLMIETKVT